MNQSLYNAVFCVGEQKIDPFAAAKIDFGKIIEDMRLGGYEITSLNVAEFIVIHQLDELKRYKNSILEESADTDNRDSYCLERYGLSYKDIAALDPTTDIEWDLKSGQVLLFLGHDVQYMEDAYMKIFGEALQKFCQDTGFMFTRLGETL